MIASVAPRKKSLIAWLSFVVDAAAIVLLFLCRCSIVVAVCVRNVRT